MEAGTGIEDEVVLIYCTSNSIYIAPDNTPLSLIVHCIHTTTQRAAAGSDPVVSILSLIEYFVQLFFHLHVLVAGGRRSGRGCISALLGNHALQERL